MLGISARETTNFNYLKFTSVGRGKENARMEKLFWCFLPGVILSEKRQTFQKYVVKTGEKSQFPLEILIKKSRNFLNSFRFLIVFGANYQDYDFKDSAEGFLIFASCWKLFMKCWFSRIPPQIRVDFLQNSHHLFDGSFLI